ncbi:NitT/TauT family transport system permease protein [Streptomyces aurantiacus]|uniref:ABC transporter permease n=1 Tax=Streptomyces aurantiacus TaxID=47760 RepID=UPI0027935C9D|nr:ABC transporter permease [Streptomyces aurantiacus]MDQ0777498.1 NitT/TauT family transport system permease protein [Streptomyces aurantiacus]
MTVLDTAQTSVAEAPAKSRRGGRPIALRTVLPPLGALVAMIALWQLVIVAFDIPGYMLPSPMTMVDTVLHEADSILTPTWVTLRESVLGFVVAAVVGVASALVMGRWRLMERSLYPYLILLQTIPIVAIAPLFVVWLGPGMATNTMVAAMIALFPVAANTLQGLKSTDRNLVQLYAMAGAPARVQLLFLRLPGALPEILTGLRVAAGASVIGAIVGEFVAGVGGGAGGLGYVITESAVQLRTPQLFLAVFGASVVSLLLFAVVVAAERFLLGKWHESALPTDE